MIDVKQQSLFKVGNQKVTPHENMSSWQFMNWKLATVPKLNITNVLITTSKPRSCEWMLLPSNYPSQAGERFGPPKAQTETHSNFKGNGHTECVVWNFAISNCCRITVHNWHYVGKAKMYFRDGSWKKCKQTAGKCKKIFKLLLLKHILPLPT